MNVYVDTTSTYIYVYNNNIYLLKSHIYIYILNTIQIADKNRPLKKS